MKLFQNTLSCCISKNTALISLPGYADFRLFNSSVKSESEIREFGKYFRYKTLFASIFPNSPTPLNNRAITSFDHHDSLYARITYDLLLPVFSVEKVIVRVQCLHLSCLLLLTAVLARFSCLLSFFLNQPTLLSF